MPISVVASHVHAHQCQLLRTWTPPAKEFHRVEDNDGVCPSVFPSAPLKWTLPEGCLGIISTLICVTSSSSRAGKRAPNRGQQGVPMSHPFQILSALVRACFLLIITRISCRPLGGASQTESAECAWTVWVPSVHLAHTTGPCQGSKCQPDGVQSCGSSDWQF